MKREIVLERVLNRTRMALLEDGRVCEYRADCDERREPTGGIYVGRVQNVLPGMNAAFVDIGLGKNAYLAASDIGIDTRGEAALMQSLRAVRIEKLLHAGQMLLCQVIKEPGGDKGPRISQNITLPGRLAVLLPTLSYTGVSKKIDDAQERKRLQGIAAGLAQEGGAGMIVRTAAAGAEASELKDEYAALCAQWRRIEAEAALSQIPRRIETGESFAESIIRDYLTEDIASVRTDDAELYGELCAAAAQYAPALRDRISQAAFETPLFDLLRVDRQIEDASERRLNLKSGGTIVIDETEAMTVIDVNTGKFVGKRDLEETVFRLNCEAADEIAIQVRLRDAAGIIIIDFIDMESQQNRDALVERLRSAFANDRSRVTVLGMTELGLVQMTRKKIRRPLSRTLAHTCPLCRGAGRVPTPETQAFAAIREIWRRRRAGDTTHYKIVANERIASAIRASGFTDGTIHNANRAGFEIMPDENKGEAK